MLPYWSLFILASGIICGMCKPSSRYIDRRKDIPKGFYSKQTENTWKNRFFLGKRNMFDRIGDEPQKQGSFKIDDGKVIGGGIYEMNKDGVSLDIKLKINPNLLVSPPCVPAPSHHPTAAPSGQVSASPPNRGTSGSTAGPTPGGAGLSPGNGGEGGSDYQQEALLLHNKFRKIHDAPPMTLNAEMSQAATSYAEQLSKLGMNNMHHSSREERKGDGENLSAGCTTNHGQTAEQAVTGWYNEVCKYTFGSEGMSGAGHFTQLVWKASVELGFGKADIDEDGMKCTYYVARYRPAGNMIGEFAENVLKGSFDPNYCNTVKPESLFKRTRG